MPCAAARRRSQASLDSLACPCAQCAALHGLCSKGGHVGTLVLAASDDEKSLAWFWHMPSA